MLNTAALQAMKQIDVQTADRETLVEMQDAVINPDLPRRERILDYISQIGNPYCFKHNGMVVKIGFAKTGVTLDDRMEQYFRSM